jgi:histidinol-phosphate aminotransferase
MPPMNKAIFNLIRTHYQTLEGYVSAGMEMVKDDSKIFLNANENPYELPGLEGFNRYPEPQPRALLAAFAQAYGVESDNVVITRGADEAIAILIKLFCEPHQDKVVLTPPTFGMYVVGANGMPAGVVNVPLIKKDGTFALDKDGIIAAGRQDHVKLVFLCSPNNPTATSFPHDEIAEIIDALEGHAMVILDETYAEFSTAGSMVDDLESTLNLIILRTLSKSYAFAGMRMGCFLSGDREFIALCRKKTLDAYPLPSASIEAAFHVLSPEISEIARENIKKLLAERERVKGLLLKSKQVTHIYPSDANFLLVEMKDAKGFAEYAKARNVILRDFSGKAGTENCLRISIGLPEENEKMLELLRNF